MRPGLPRVKIADARVSHINGLFWVNLDAFGLDPGEQPRPHDFRASETYAAGRELWWEEVTAKPKGWRARTSHAASTAARAAMTPQWMPVPAISSPLALDAHCERLRLPGNPCPSGFLSGPTAAQAGRAG